MSADRRIHARVTTRIPGRLVRGGDVIDGVVENVGQGGVFFATEVLEVPVDDGAEVVVEFTARRDAAPDPERLRLAGTVLRSERYFDGTAVVRAFAVRFAAPLDLAGLAFD